MSEQNKWIILLIRRRSHETEVADFIFSRRTPDMMRTVFTSLHPREYLAYRGEGFGFTYYCALRGTKEFYDSILSTLKDYQKTCSITGNPLFLFDWTEETERVFLNVFEDDVCGMSELGLM